MVLLHKCASEQGNVIIVSVGVSVGVYLFMHVQIQWTRDLIYLEFKLRTSSWNKQYQIWWKLWLLNVVLLIL